MTDKVCPPLGSGSVDLNALHDDVKAGKDPAEALAAATTRVAPLTQEEAAELPSLSGKTKSELLKIAEAEGVDADDGMTNAAIIDAITFHRSATPVVDDAGNVVSPDLSEDSSPYSPGLDA